MASSPQEMAEYYDGFPTPPEEPASAEEMAEFEQGQAAHESAHGPPPTPAPVTTAPAAGGGMPAARVGDMTAHGGVIVGGCQQVLIGGKPAARLSDLHNCPMFTGLVPHVCGPIAKGSSAVMIGFLPAARVGDQAICAGPSDVIAMGEFMVMIG